uniref:Uncharacterized protein n=1 Tax=Babesia bovis TaxID=5865 RepID=S6B2B7_BABBO|nr:hypothetical protein [Babesia bovis]
MFLDSCIITPNCNNDVEKCEKVDSGTIKSIGNNRIEEKFYHPRELNDNVGKHEMLSNSKLVFEKQTSSNTIVTEEEVLTNVLCNGTSTDVEYKILETPNNEVTKNDENDGVENDASKISDNNDVLLTGNAEINFVNIVDGSKYCNDDVVVGNRANESSDEVEHELIPTVSMDHDTLLQIVPPRYPLPHCTSSTIPMNTCYRGRFFMVLERIQFNITGNTFKRLSRCINRGSEHNITAECISRQKEFVFQKTLG